MFERFSEKARRVIFVVRYETSQYGSPYIETEHLLLGLQRENQALVNMFRGQGNVELEIRTESSTSADQSGYPLRSKSHWRSRAKKYYA